MRLGIFPLAVCAGVLLCPGLLSAQTARMTLAEVLSRAREHAPRVVSARLALEQARARLAGAGLRFQNNPELDAAVGRRRGGTATSVDLEFGVQQTFEPGARRTARVAAASEGIAQATAEIEATARTVLRAAAAAFLRAAHSAERVRLLATAEEVASQIHAVADRRFKAGDIAVLDVNIARASLARVRADGRSALATELIALGDLRQLLGIEGEIAIEHSLSPGDVPALGALLQSAAERPELRGLEAAIREAEAGIRLARTYRRPDVGFGARYEREESDQVVLGAVTVTLPTFAKGQELLALSSATVSRLRTDLEAERLRIRIEVQSAFDAYRRRVEAVRVLQEQALPGLDENEALTARSFEVGQLGLAELLLIRREILDTRFQYLDTLMEAALARIELHASAAVLR